MLGKTRGCGCGHHGLSRAIGWLTVIAGLVFLYTVWWNTTLFGFDATAWFEHVVVFGVGLFALSGCSCCCGKECCGTCPVQKS
ncbi:MAG: hypothetical protein UV63_C0037G0012 [Microgenomates group bacterium GW2011_GWC1_43_11]|uniref:Transmembrane protein n=1 Tax=Candidatus Gottesmanbacteria bacterium GW2011_GWB1_44_11c TaxID=1618447 RepID=A0A0G1GN82_9BACT|nr:MAG: hypothetical protein UV63_C0037G0012 [Microgenomates group bacterium GW2011_GWC1_43_11]KKT27958.1 MAG: hypothetical protein UW14_C0018G0011 [Candidatus Yanofskybacteria bacterium GW2011_GWA2_44_10]KKT35798.1 MAG: hypothetical protein UW22_C0048G0015 [Candidatus Gottesmanbacteria bacterium GW2011_GWB1_44_11c]